MSIRMWNAEAGHLECRWFETGRQVEYRPRWMEQTREIQSAYLAPVTDFASHSPFGGTESWFQLHLSSGKRK